MHASMLELTLWEETSLVDLHLSWTLHTKMAASDLTA